MPPTPHVVAVNFRDPGHPEAGGAELHLEEILLEAVRRGWRVTWLASGFPGGARESEHRGMRERWLERNKRAGAATRLAVGEGSAGSGASPQRS